MLVLARKHNESVAVGNADRGEPMLIVTVLEVNNSRAILGFQAAKDVPVNRWEVWERIVAKRPMAFGSDSKPRRKARECVATAYVAVD